jgi:hypothetical protein
LRLLHRALAGAVRCGEKTGHEVTIALDHSVGAIQMALIVALRSLHSVYEPTKRIARRMLLDLVTGRRVSAAGLEVWKYGDQDELRILWGHRKEELWIYNSTSEHEDKASVPKPWRGNFAYFAGQCDTCLYFTKLQAAYSYGEYDEGYSWWQFYCPRCVKIDREFQVYMTYLTVSLGLPNS